MIPVWFAAAVLAACQTVSGNTEQPARIVEPDDASRAALQQAVNNALGTEVLLAADALTTTSLLVIERQVPQGIAGSPAEGRVMDKPIQFQLMTTGKDCILVDRRDGSRYPLQDVSCIADEEG